MPRRWRTTSQRFRAHKAGRRIDPGPDLPRPFPRLRLGPGLPRSLHCLSADLIIELCPCRTASHIKVEQIRFTTVPEIDATGEFALKLQTVCRTTEDIANPDKHVGYWHGHSTPSR
jgi:hypothetical protein